MTTDVAHEVRLLANRLQETKPGEAATYADLSGVIGRDCRSQPTRPLLYQAQRLAQEESGAVFKTVRKVGFRRLLADELPKIGQTARRQMRRKARVAAKKLTAGIRGLNDVHPEVLREVLREQSVLGLVEQLARDNKLPKISEGGTKPLTPREAANAFLKSFTGS